MLEEVGVKLPLDKKSWDLISIEERVDLLRPIFKGAGYLLRFYPNK